MKRALVLIPLLFACAQQQQPYRFALPQPPATLDVVAGALASLGQPVAASNPAAGVLSTEWRDTGFGYGYIQSVPATIVRRYIVTVASAQPSGASVQVRAEVQKCAGAAVTATTVSGPCEQIDGLVPKHQEELNALGAQLRQSLGGQ